MPKVPISKGKPPTKGLRILAYGFDAKGFTVPPLPVSLTDIGEIEFIPLQSPKNLDGADGVVIPQGIFEQIEYHRTLTGTASTVKVSKALLLEREKQVLNLLQEGKWVCFLVGEIIDTVPQDWDTQVISDTDLCKRVLNTMGLSRSKRWTVDGVTLFDTKYDEFRAYMRDYGVANTVFDTPDRAQDLETRVLARSARGILGVEFFGRLFFLPFHTTGRSSSTAEAAVTTVVKAIIDYRQKRVAEVPAWADEFIFETEEKLESEYKLQIEQAGRTKAQADSWKNYKAILSTSGDTLKILLVGILERFFTVKVDPIDENREDAKIIDEKGETLALIESKGTKAGVRQENINQVDSHRERNGLADSVPGILLINNEMSVSGIDQRLATKVAGEQITHARNLNVLIIRTIDLLFLMRQLENRPDKKEELMRLITARGGWLKADPKSYQIVTS